MHQFWPYFHLNYTIFCKISSKICNFFLFFCSLSLIFVFFPHFLQIFLSFFENILIWSSNFEEVLEFWKQRIKRDFGKIRIFQKNIHPCMENDYFGPCFVGVPYCWCMTPRVSWPIFLNPSKNQIKLFNWSNKAGYFIDCHDIQRILNEFLLPFTDKYLEKIQDGIFDTQEINVQIS